jgi:hypothetical protein
MTIEPTHTRVGEPDDPDTVCVPCLGVTIGIWAVECLRRRVDLVEEGRDWASGGFGQQARQ